MTLVQTLPDDELTAEQDSKFRLCRKLLGAGLILHAVIHGRQLKYIKPISDLSNDYLNEIEDLIVKHNSDFAIRAGHYPNFLSWYEPGYHAEIFHRMKQLVGKKTDQGGFVAIRIPNGVRSLEEIKQWLKENPYDGGALSCQDYLANTLVLRDKEGEVYVFAYSGNCSQWKADGSTPFRSEWVDDIVTGRVEGKHKTEFYSNGIQILAEGELIEPLEIVEDKPVMMIEENDLMYLETGLAGLAFGQSHSQDYETVKLRHFATHYYNFVDQYGLARAVVGDKVLEINNTSFKRVLATAYYADSKNMPSQIKVDSVAKVLSTEVETVGRNETVELRVSRIKEGLVYDLCNGKYVIIMPDTWLVTDDPHGALFIRYGQLPQTEPAQSYSPDILDKLMELCHIEGDNKRLLAKVLLCSYFVPDIPRPLCGAFGEQGSGKSTFQTLAKMLVDPTGTSLLGVSKEKDEFQQQLYHNYLLVLDNMTYVPAWFSDEVCKAVTGTGVNKRKLYTDDEQITYFYRRAIMINGINSILDKPDALERSLMLEFDRIPENERRAERDVKAQFESIKPELLACIFDTLSKAMAKIPNLELSGLPRMADFTIWGEAIARVLGHQPLEFKNAYNANMKGIDEEALNSNPFAYAIQKLLGKKTLPYTDTAGNIYQELLEILEQERLEAMDKRWPKAANKLGNNLKTIATLLRDSLNVEYKTGSDETNRTTITFFHKKG